jgi:hypothetical protein
LISHALNLLLDLFFVQDDDFFIAHDIQSSSNLRNCYDLG